VQIHEACGLHGDPAGRYCSGKNCRLATVQTARHWPETIETATLLDLIMAQECEKGGVGGAAFSL
jgi:hypothetical protein